LVDSVIELVEITESTNQLATNLFEEQRFPVTLQQPLGSRRCPGRAW